MENTLRGIYTQRTGESLPELSAEESFTVNCLAATYGTGAVTRSFTAYVEHGFGSVSEWILRFETQQKRWEDRRPAA